MMATALALCLPTADRADVITIYAPTSRAAADARAVLPLDVVVVAAPAWSIARAALAASSCLIVRTPPGSSEPFPRLAGIRRAHPRLAVVYQTDDAAARAAAMAQGLAHEVVAWDDTRSTLWSRVQGALTAVLLETAVREARSARHLPPAVRAWLSALWTPAAPAAPLRSVAEVCAAAGVDADTLEQAWPLDAPSPDVMLVWTLVLHSATRAARGDSWRAAAEGAGMDPRALRHALAQYARLRAGELGAPVVPAADNPHTRLRAAFRQALEPIVGTTD